VWQVGAESIEWDIRMPLRCMAEEQYRFFLQGDCLRQIARRLRPS
jgi:hypothetical protein